MFYKLCDFYVKMNPLHNKICSMAEKFLYDGAIPIGSECITLEKYTRERLQQYQAMKDYSHLSLEEIEFILLAADFHTKILDFNAVMLHSSAVVHRGECCLFSAPSGFGKSTHTKMWQRLFDAEIINDDSPVIRLIDGKPVVYGSPFSGGTFISEDKASPLKAIVFLERARDNSVTELNNREATKLFLLNTLRPTDPQRVHRLFDTFDTLYRQTKFFRLKCNTDKQAAVLAEKHIYKENDYEG